MSDRIVVTGGAGFIGSHLVRRMLREGHEVVVLDDCSTGSWDNLPRSPRLLRQDGSVLSREDVRDACRGADLVCHLAGVVGVRLAYAERERAYDVASRGTDNMLRASGTVPAVLFSSSAVYGVEAERVTEDDAICRDEAVRLDRGIPGYVTGKLALEEIGASTVRGGRTVLVLRPFNVVGVRQVSAYGMVVPTFVERAMRGEALRIYGDGTQTRSFSDVGTFVGCTMRLAAMLRRMRGETVFNVGTPTSTSIVALARIVLEETGSASAIEHVPYASVFRDGHDVRARQPSPDRLHAVLGPVHWNSTRGIVRRCGKSVV